MAVLLNLSIARKMALCAGLSLLLLGGLVWGVLTAMSHQQVLDDRLTAANRAERASLLTRQAVQGMRLASRELELAQNDAAAQPIRETINQRQSEAEQQVGVLLATVGSGHEAAEHLQALLRDYGAKLERQVQLRGAVLRQRDNGFLPTLPVFDAADGRLRERLSDGTPLPAGHEMLGSQIKRFVEATNRTRNAMLLLLSAGVEPGAGWLGDDDRVAAGVTSEVSGRPVPEPLNSELAALLQSGSKLRQAVPALSGFIKALGVWDRTQTGPAASALNRALAAAAEDGMAAAAAAQSDALAGRQRATRVVIGLGGVIFAVVLASNMLVGRAVARPIAAMTGSVQRMAQGETDTTIGFAGRRDEIGRMAAALEVLRAAVGRADIQAQMLEQLPVGVMTCDPQDDFRIRFVNAEAVRLLRAVQEHLPVAVDELVGCSVDVFHRNPVHQRAILSDPSRLPFRARVRLGEEVFDLKVSALRDPLGNYAAPMLVWGHVTRQVRLSDTFESLLGGIATSIERAACEMEQTATGMSEAAAGSGHRLAIVEGASHAATGNVQVVAVNAEELAASVVEIARRVAESAAIAGQAVAEADATDRSVAGLSEAAGRIGDVVRLIGDIAGRTNLLALNATIEAARAGEAGRGFAVVAGEVKVLASQTARATEEIAGQIRGMQAATGQAVAALRSIGGTIGRMSEIATAIAAAVEQQGAATGQIARSVQQAAEGTGEVDRNIGEVSRAVQATGQQADGVAGAARALTSESAVLSRAVAEFLADMRAAA